MERIHTQRSGAVTRRSTGAQGTAAPKSVSQIMSPTLFATEGANSLKPMFIPIAAIVASGHQSRLLRTL